MKKVNPWWLLAAFLVGNAAYGIPDQIINTPQEYSDGFDSGYSFGYQMGYDEGFIDGSKTPFWGQGLFPVIGSFIVVFFVMGFLGIVIAVFKSSKENEKESQT